MRLWSDSFENETRLPGEFAFCVPDAAHHVKLSNNRNPHLAWTDVPEGTRSFVLVCHDPDVPTRPDDVNQEDREVPADLPRADFYHWLLVDLSPQVRSIDAASFSKEVTPRGKGGPASANGTRQGINDYTSWFAGDHDMEGDYYGYDGPCPPWNDALLHHYVFTLYALDFDRLPLDGTFRGPEVMAAIESHVLAKASVTGTYTLNPRLG